MKRVHIVGRKNSGKTTLIVDLVRHLTAKGYRVGTIKHTHHHHELDTPGKDSHRHREAGAAAVGILSPGMTAVFRPTGQTVNDATDRYDELAPMFADCDIVVVEGNLQTTAFKVEVWRAAVTEQPIAAEDSSIAAVITDDPIDIAVPTWSRSDVSRVAQTLLEVG
ncbi:MAG: molybdopterin-guanine dinucleotide biosynthesis protein B [Planctomycetota bacterium]|nr:molybdopterin-guanine dinucleotide biosynthesis protein B [Planctomycetota bacterium]